MASAGGDTGGVAGGLAGGPGGGGTGRDGTDESGSDEGGLRATPPLGALVGGIALTEVTGRALVTIALPHASSDAHESVRRHLEAAFETALPGVGRSVETARGERLLGLQSDRLYVLFDADDAADPERALRERLGPEGGTDPRTDGGAGGTPTLCLNDQSDAWVMLRVAGARVRRALERVCPLDLHPDVYPIGAVARTVFEHLGTIVLRETEDTFLLLSPRSSARSFLDEIETSVRHAHAPA